jgi:hypothetical protein
MRNALALIFVVFLIAAVAPDLLAWIIAGVVLLMLATDVLIAVLRSFRH